LATEGEEMISSKKRFMKRAIRGRAQAAYPHQKAEMLTSEGEA
jgi:hypothetical protein